MGNTYACRNCSEKLEPGTTVNYCYRCINKCERCNTELGRTDEKRYVGSGQVCLRCYYFHHAVLIYPPQ